jgi:hypothetical protein
MTSGATGTACASAIVGIFFGSLIPLQQTSGIT